ncbi:conserved hypothetical protein [Tenacibaculum maritimum]|nr:conserved hypothetical protein [Tenacibaculum maritimum]
MPKVIISMDFNTFLSKVPLIKTKRLGGLDAQFKLAPEMRLRYSENKIKALNPRKAAVLALFYPNKASQTCILLTKRASYKGTHSAQVSFPGGKVDKTDKNLQETALREAHEEMGIPKNLVTVLRETTDVYIPPSNFLATPFIAVSSQKPDFIMNEEVAETIEVLVADLLNDANISAVNLSTSYATNINVPCFKLNNYTVWGATAMMLSEIRELLI